MGINNKYIGLGILVLMGVVHPVSAQEPEQESIGIFYSHDVLSNGQTPWQVQSLKWQKEQKKSSSLAFEINNYYRFDQSDLSFTGQYIRFIDPDWYLDATLTYSPNPTVIKNYSLQFWSHHDRGQGLILSIGTDLANYPTDTVDIQTASMLGELEKYIGKYRYSYRVNMNHVRLPAASSQTLFSHTFSLAYYYQDRSNITVMLALGKELENDGSSSPPVSQVSSFTLKHTHYYANRYQSVVGLSWHQQGTIYNRTGITAGIAYEY